MNVRRCLALGTLVATLAVPALASAQTWYPAPAPVAATGCAHPGYPVAVAPQGYPVAADRGWDRRDEMRRDEGMRGGFNPVGFVGHIFHHLREGLGFER